MFIRKKVFNFRIFTFSGVFDNTAHQFCNDYVQMCTVQYISLVTIIKFNCTIIAEN